MLSGNLIIVYQVVKTISAYVTKSCKLAIGKVGLWMTMRRTCPVAHVQVGSVILYNPNHC